VEHFLFRDNKTRRFASANESKHISCGKSKFIVVSMAEGFTKNFFVLIKSGSALHVSYKGDYPQKIAPGDAL